MVKKKAQLKFFSRAFVGLGFAIKIHAKEHGKEKKDAIGGQGYKSRYPKNKRQYQTQQSHSYGSHPTLLMVIIFPKAECHQFYPAVVYYQFHPGVGYRQDLLG
jgi:hypothetical protein